MNTQDEKHDNPDYSRRAWLVSAGRWSAFGVLGVLSVGMLARDGEFCSHCGPGGCGDCSELKRCSLPGAVGTKQRIEKERDDHVGQ